MLALLALAGCGDDPEDLAAHLPRGITVQSVLSTDSRTLSCQRATFRIRSDADAAFNSFQTLSRLGEDTLDCVRGAERDYWTRAVAEGRVLAEVKQGRRAVHIWVDTLQSRALVMEIMP